MGIRRPIEFKLEAYRLYREGKRPTQAFAIAGIIHDQPLSGCMMKKEWAASYMSDDIRGFLKKQAASGNQQVIDFANTYNYPELLRQ